MAQRVCVAVVGCAHRADILAGVVFLFRRVFKLATDVYLLKVVSVCIAMGPVPQICWS